MRLNFASFDESETCIGKRSKKSIGVPRLNFAGFRRRYNSALKQCGTKGFAFVRFGALCCAGAPPPVRRASLQAARRVGAPRPEAQPARARPQAGARDCAEPEEQGGASQPVTAAQEGSARGRRAPATLGITRRIEQNQHFGSGSTLLNTAGVCRGSGSKVRER